MSNEIKTQGTEIFLLDSDASPAEVLKIGNVPNLGAVGGEADDIEVTNLDDLRFKQYLAGLMDPGNPTMPFNLSKYNDQWAATHSRILDIVGGERYFFAIGLSDGVGIPPTISGGEFVLPPDRSWVTFQASVKAAPLTFEANSVVRVDASLRNSGEIVLTRKSV